MGAEKDCLAFAPLVRSGGLIALHDIMPHRVHHDCQVHVFWDRLKKRINRSEIIDRDGYEHWGGIGYLDVPPNGLADVVEEIEASRRNCIASVND